MDTSSGGSLFFYISFTELICHSRFLYDKKDASFVDPPPPADAHANSEPPHNCTTCALREEEDMQTRGRIIRKAGAIIGVAMHGMTFHVGDFALLRAEKGPARIVQVVGFYSGDPIWIKAQLLGRVSELVDLLPADELKDEVSLFTSSTLRPTLFFLLAPFVLYRRNAGCVARGPARAVLRPTQRSHLRHEPVDRPRCRVLLLPISFLTVPTHVVERARAARGERGDRMRNLRVCAPGAHRRSLNVCRGGTNTKT